MPVLESGYSQYLFTSAKHYLELGYSVLPVYGDLDPQRAKISPIQWTVFRHHRATETNLRRWYLDQHYGGLAIITGRLSHLAVLDFDDPALAQAFARQYPDLVQTRTIQSGGRGLPHYYYDLPPRLDASSRKAPGADWQADGRYVIAPPTTMAQGAWQVMLDRQPKTLTESDLSRILAFLRAQTPETPQNVSSRPLWAIVGMSSVDSSAAVDLKPAPTNALSPDSLLRRYATHALRGRNDALFDTACWARDHGWGMEDIARYLVEEHVKKPPSGVHTPELPEQRRREAISTLKSVFSRPPRLPADRSSAFVSNTVREALLQRKETATLRVLEALYLAGWQPGCMFTEREARGAARKCGVGEWSVRKALAATQADAAGETDSTPNNKCFFVTRSKPQLNQKRGRPVHYYILPGHKEMCEKLRLTPSGGNRLAPDDLKSCRAYRRAVLRELIKRRPGLYSRDWMAGLLGVSVVTTRRYTRDLPFLVYPTYHSHPVSHANLDSLVPPDLHDAPAGAFLEDEHGKKYPPMRAIAKRLLRKSRYVWYRWRGVNYYGYAKMETVSPTLDTGRGDLPDRPFTTPDRHDIGALHAVSASLSASVCLERPAEPLILSYPPGKRPPDKKLPPDYTQPFTDARMEQAGGALYEAMQQMTLSLTRARELVARYSPFAVQETLIIVRQRVGLRNPVGFLVKLLESHYSFHREEGLDMAETHAAEQAYRVTHEMNPQHGLSWKNACELAQTYGQPAIENALITLRQRPNVKNPAAYLITLLRHPKPSGAVSNAPQNEEQFAEHVYRTIRAMNPQRILSREKTRRLIDACGRKAVEEALYVLSQRRNIHNPAGFLITLLRANHIVRDHDPKTDMTPEERHRVWMEEMRSSPYLSFYANAEDFIE